MAAKKDEIKRELEQRVLEMMDYSRETSDEEVCDMIDQLFMREESLRICTAEERRQLKKDIFCALRRLGILQNLLEDKEVTEIMINGPSHLFAERNGRLEKLEEQFESADKLLQIIQKIVAGCNRSVNEASPIVDARLADGSRVNVVLAPVAINGPIVTIRRFFDKPVTMEQLLSWGSITEEAVCLLQKLVRAKYNIFISGGTGSGKTTFLNALSEFIPSDERIITIEDSAELQIRGIDNLIRMETRNENVEGCHAISIRELTRASLRMRPDRIVVGEVRGSEAVDMMTAFICTI